MKASSPSPISAEAILAAGPLSAYPAERLRTLIPRPMTLREFFKVDDALFDLPRWDRLLFISMVLPAPLVHRLALLGAYRLRHAMREPAARQAVAAKCRFLRGRLSESELRVRCSAALIAYSQSWDKATEVAALSSLPEAGAFALRAAIKAAGPSGSNERLALYEEMYATAIRLYDRMILS